MSEEHERKQSLKNREFQFSPFSDSVRIPLQLLAFAKKEGYSIYKPGLQRDRESSEKKLKMKMAQSILLPAQKLDQHI